MPSISDVPNLSSGVRLVMTILIIVFVSLLAALVGAWGIVTLYTAFQEQRRPKEEKSMWDTEEGLTSVLYELEDGAPQSDYSPKLPSAPPAVHVSPRNKTARPAYSVHDERAAGHVLANIRTGFSALELHDYAWPSRLPTSTEDKYPLYKEFYWNLEKCTPRRMWGH
ncbi:hypothetical protein AX15_007579 [Amanita polypyramis BW_CC]|nr:hypothetical protein AX15_007579 [Amanita polypyramis BW_CC]